MAESLQWKIPFALYGHLNSLIPSANNPLSLLVTPDFAAETAPGVDSDIIREAGIKDALGNLSPAFQRALQVLADPEACAELKVISGNEPYQNTFYFSKGFSRSVSVLNAGDHLIISDPGKLEETLVKVQEFVGSNSIRYHNFSTSLPYNQVLVLSVLIDLQRKFDLLSLIENRPISVSLADSQDVIEHINQVNVQGSSQWLTAHIQRKGKPEFDIYQLDIALQDLENKGVIIKIDNKYRLSAQVELIPVLFGLFTSVMDLDILRFFRNSNHKVSLSSTCLQSGVNDLLVLSSRDSQVQVTISDAKTYLEDIKYQLNGNGISQIEEPKNEDEYPEATIVLGSPDLIWQLVSRDTGKPIALKDVMRLGRNPDNQIIFNEPSISRAHAIIEIQNSECWITDLNSRNGTFVNNAKIKQPTRLNNRDILKIGPFEFEVNSVLSGVLPTQSIPRQNPN